MSAAQKKNPLRFVFDHIELFQHEVKINNPLEAEYFDLFIYLFFGVGGTLIASPVTIGDFSEKQNTKFTTHLKYNMWSQFPLPGQIANLTV